jgi:hypothetical protein
MLHSRTGEMGQFCFKAASRETFRSRPITGIVRPIVRLLFENHLSGRLQACLERDKIGEQNQHV